MTMTNDEILQRLGLQDDSDEAKQETLQMIIETVDMRVMSVLSEVLSISQINHLTEMESNGVSRDEMFKWLVDEGFNTGEIYDAALEDYVNEMAARTQPQA